MPSGGATQLKDLRDPQLIVVCEQCNRRGVYSVSKLIAQYTGDEKLPDLIWKLTGCERKTYSDFCKARYGNERDSTIRD